MSIPVGKRSEAKVLFIQDIINGRKKLISIIKKLPKSYTHIITNNMAELGAEVYKCAMCGNSIYIGDTSLKEDFDLRRRYFQRAQSALTALIAELNFCYDLVDQGNNYFENKEDYAKKFVACAKLFDSAVKRIRKIMTSDKTRWNKIQAKIDSAEA